MLGGDEREGEMKKKTIGLGEVKTETFWEERNGVGGNGKGERERRRYSILEDQRRETELDRRRRGGRG